MSLYLIRIFVLQPICFYGSEVSVYTILSFVENFFFLTLYTTNLNIFTHYFDKVFLFPYYFKSYHQNPSTQTPFCVSIFVPYPLLDNKPTIDITIRNTKRIYNVKYIVKYNCNGSLLLFRVKVLCHRLLFRSPLASQRYSLSRSLL